MIYQMRFISELEVVAALIAGGGLVKNKKGRDSTKNKPTTPHSSACIARGKQKYVLCFEDWLSHLGLTQFQ